MGAVFREIVAQHDRNGADEESIRHGLDYREKAGITAGELQRILSALRAQEFIALQPAWRTMCDRRQVMAMQNVLAGVAVRNAASSAEWYAQLIGQPGRTPMPGVREWTLPSGGVLQVIEDPRRAGASSVTFSVTDLEDHVARLANRDVRIGARTRSADVSTVTINDPDGNQVVLAEPHSERVAR